MFLAIYGTDLVLKAEVHGEARLISFRAFTGVCGGQFGDQPHIAGDAFTLCLAAVMLARFHIATGPAPQ